MKIINDELSETCDLEDVVSHYVVLRQYIRFGKEIIGYLDGIITSFISREVDQIQEINLPILMSYDIDPKLLVLSERNTIIFT